MADRNQRALLSFAILLILAIIFVAKSIRRKNEQNKLNALTNANTANQAEALKQQEEFNRREDLIDVFVFGLSGVVLFFVSYFLFFGFTLSFRGLQAYAPKRKSRSLNTEERMRWLTYIRESMMQSLLTDKTFNGDFEAWKISTEKKQTPLRFLQENFDRIVAAKQPRDAYNMLPSKIKGKIWKMVGQVEEIQNYPDALDGAIDYFGGVGISIARKANTMEKGE